MAESQESRRHTVDLNVASDFSVATGVPGVGAPGASLGETSSMLLHMKTPTLAARRCVKRRWLMGTRRRRAT